MEYPKLVPELLCSEISASSKFYVGILGFEILYERPEEGFAYLNIDGAHLMLEEATEDMGPSRAGGRQNLNTLMAVASICKSMLKT